jgi:hypothetical protein
MLATSEATTAAAIAAAANRPDEIAGAPAAINHSGRFVIPGVADPSIRYDTAGQQERPQPNRHGNGAPA